jgi:large subunit ribosomal protein L25
MKLPISKRAVEKKSDTKKLRRDAQVPGVLYGLNGGNQNISFPLDQLQAILRQIRPGLLATTVFELVEGEQTYKALVKEIQYHPATYAILHMDFLFISGKRPVTVNVPIQISGLAECAGVKLGGFVRQVIRSMKVSCAHDRIPQEFILDVKDLGVAESRTLATLTMPAGVKPLAKMNEVAVLVAKKA